MLTRTRNERAVALAVRDENSDDRIDHRPIAARHSAVLHDGRFPAGPDELGKPFARSIGDCRCSHKRETTRSPVACQVTLTRAVSVCMVRL